MLDAVLRPPAPREKPAARWFLLAAALAVPLAVAGAAACSRGAAHPVPFFLGSLLLVPGLPTLDYGLRRYRLLRLIETTRTSTAATLDAGPCELEGAVEVAGEPLRAPRSGKPCAWYHYRVTQRAGKHTKVLKDETRGAPFYCRDETGRVLVDPAGIAPAAVSRDLQEKEGDVTYEEHRLDPGDKLYVLGVAHPRADAAGLIVSLGDSPVFYIWNLTQHDAALALLRRAALAAVLGLQLAALGAFWIYAGFAG